MPASTDLERVYYAQCRYKDRTGESKKKAKRASRPRRKRAIGNTNYRNAWRAPLPCYSPNSMEPIRRMRMRLRRTTRKIKANMIENKILPFLGHKRVNEITAPDILNWETSSWPCARATGSNTRRPAYTRSATNSLPCSTTPSATTDSHRIRRPRSATSKLMR